jgi:hypothetical protein
MTTLAELSVDELADGICLRAGRIAAAQAELLMWIAEFDRREGWAGHGILTCAHWLSWRLGLSPPAAREQVRVARKLEELPEVTAAFLDGRITYSKARAITRAAEVDDGIDWVALARHSSGAQLEKIARGVRRARTNEAARLDPPAAEWSLRTRMRYDDNGNFILTISGPAEYAPVIQGGIDAKRAELQRERDAAAAAAEAVPATASRASAEAPDAPDASEAPPAELPQPAASVAADLDAQAPGWPAGVSAREVREAAARFLDSLPVAEDAEPREPVEPRPAVPPTPLVPAPDASAEAPQTRKVSDAEALLALAQEALGAEQKAHPDIARRRRLQLTAHIDPLSGWARQVDGELLPPSSLRAVMKTLPGRDGVLRLRPVTAADLRRHDLGRTQRETNLALRELLGTIDGERCRFPGCTRHKKLHAHHVVYWSAGGATDFDNLVLVCPRHHTLIHQHGFRLVLHADRRLEVRTADGVAILHHPAQPWGDPAALAVGRNVSSESLPPDHCTERMDLGYVVSVLMAQAS